MNDILMIMNARDIPECINSIKSLEIDKVWFRGYTETELETVINDFIKSTNYKRYILLSDDVIATQESLDKVLYYSNQINKDTIITGWCNISPVILRGNIQIDKPTYSSMFKFITKMPHFIGGTIKSLFNSNILPVKKIYIKLALKMFPTYKEIYSENEIFRTYFIGWSFTSISKEIWLKYPFMYPRKHENATGSDMLLSNILNKNNVYMLCIRDAFIYHLHSMENFIVGKVKREVILEPYKDD